MFLYTLLCSIDKLSDQVASFKNTSPLTKFEFIFDTANLHFSFYGSNFSIHRSGMPKYGSHHFMVGRKLF